MSKKETTIRIGTRASALALWQARRVKRALEERSPDILIELETIKTTGDRILDSPLSRIGDKGLFTKEIERALLEGRIDLAVHSLKDLPTSLPAGLTIGAVLERGDTSDALVSRNDLSLDRLPSGARVATGSLRRRAQLLAFRSDLQICDIRGNVDTRIQKLKTEALDGLVMAKAGLVRLGFSDMITQTIPTEIMLPAVGQGAVAVETLEANEAAQKLIACLDHSPTAMETSCERSFMRFLEGGCQIPVGALARVGDNRIDLEGMVASLDGNVLLRDRLTGEPHEAESVGERLAERLLDMGAGKILEEIRGNSANGSRI